MKQMLKKCCAPIPQRYAVATAVLSAMAVQYIHRLAINLAITAIIIRKTEETPGAVVCKTPDEDTSVKGPNKHAEFPWTDAEEALVVGMFYLGYLITQVPGGLIADWYGPKRVMGYSALLSGICSILTPVSARISVYGLMIVRFVMGLGQGPMFPACSTFVARWSLPEGRNVMNAYTSAGVHFGAILGYTITGQMFDLLDKWDYVFYVYGVVTFIWYFAIWIIFAHDSPTKHPFITEKEQNKLIDALHEEMAYNKTKMNYRAVMTSIPVWAMIICEIGHDWAFYIIVTMLPQYMAYVLNLKSSENGLLNCLPYISMFIFQMIFAEVAERLVDKGYMTKTVQCKVWVFISNQVPVACYIAATYTGCSRLAVVALFAAAMGFMGLTYSSLRVCNVDMAPNFAGFLMSLMNGLGSLCGFFSPYLFTFFTENHKYEVNAWRNAFFFSAVMVTITTIVFILFGSSKVQPWNFPKDPEPNRPSQQATEQNRTPQQAPEQNRVPKQATADA